MRILLLTIIYTLYITPAFAYIDAALGSLVLQSLAVERMQNGVARAVGGGAGSLSGSLPVMRGHAAEGALVNFPLGGPAERNAEMLKFDNCGYRLAAHIFDRILIA